MKKISQQNIFFVQKKFFRKNIFLDEIFFQEKIILFDRIFFKVRVKIEEIRFLGFPGRCGGLEKSYGPSKTRKSPKIAILEPGGGLGHAVGDPNLENIPECRSIDFRRK